MLNIFKRNNQGDSTAQAWAVPVAIVVAGLLIASAVVVNKNEQVPTAANPGANPAAVQPIAAKKVAPVTDKDHIRGSVDAKVTVIEYSDTECPFCKRFHPTMQQLVSEYDGDDVAWVFRHFPIASLHSKAPKEAEATECAAELGGNDGFWKYLDRLTEVTPANNGLDLSELPKIAEFVGLDAKKFNDCLTSGKYTKAIADAVAAGTAAGVRGTPYSVVIAEDGTMYEISGAQPYEQVKAIVDTALAKSK